MTQIRILLNVSEPDPERRHLPMWDGYAPGDALREAFACTLATLDPAAALEEIWFIANVGDEPGFGASAAQRELALAYRARRNRSLSIGDVVVVDGTAFACERAGWRELATIPLTVA